MPPLAASVAEYATPTCPFGNALVVMRSVAGAIVSGKVPVLLCLKLPESVTLKVSDAAEAGTVGVPVMAPVAGFSVKPAGSVPALSAQL